MNLSFPYRETWLHRVNPTHKLAVSALLFLLVLLTHDPNVMLLLAVAALLPLALFSGHPPLRLLLYASPFLLLFVSSASGMMMFGSGETVWFQYGLIRITEESFYRGLHLGFRSLQVAAVGLAFALTTRPVALFYSLMQQLRLPARYAYSFLAAFNMLPLLAEEFVTLRQALQIRGGRRPRGLRGLYERLRMYAIPLLAQCIRRAHRTAAAMEAKRFASGAGARTFYYRYRLSAADAGYALYVLASTLLAWQLGQHWPLLPVKSVV
ncbi:Transmembrane component YkoC of thiamin-regulated ECF transporter for HydroxyMethylPyrimidine [Paenibacillus pasadenensis]|uniref:Transmembrane component YkoC of thiamin-regulated ECF transporter for HydroxyMethylPyrimidine n=1 Tax=Paenibacillus pasadenensis TaxID=217090 RepID=A0A2N5N0K1_9BACL|nr:energy-coupling factor transporter transmembrane component T [Paenibacillus pasadenensis]PLT43871.1 Transmembrane component YkoC of thiamin-regulated ECF transporter for HydroxyMethylPyrimidine [Paenibacillus pasadenensis]